MGSVNLDNTGSGSAITLSSDGTSLLLDGTAIGGGGGSPDLFADNDVDATAPSATGNNSVAIGPSSEANSADATAFGYRSEAKASKAVAIGEGRAGGNSATAISIGTTSTAYGATGSYSVAMGYQAKATGTYAFALGPNSVSTGQDSVAIGKSRTSGSFSFAAQIGTNSASYGAIGSYSIALGSLAKATGQSSVCLSNTSTASASNSAVLGGSSGTASGGNAVVIGGSSNVADGLYSTAKGHYGNANGIVLKHATGLYPNQQGAYYVLGYTTSGATPIALNTSVWTPSATNQIALPNNSAYTFSGTVVAREKASEGTDVGAWEIKGIIRREANAGTTVLINSVINELNVPTGWAIALTADTTFGCLKVEATGVASTNIRWVATINTSEVTYA